MLLRVAGALLLAVGLVAGGPARPAPGDIVPWQSWFVEFNPANRWIWRAAQVNAESAFRTDAVSWIVGKDGIKRPCAYGPAQFTAPTWETAKKKGWVAADARPEVPYDALRAQARYMAELEVYFRLDVRTEQGLLDASHGGYNAGPYSIKKAIWKARQLGLPGESDWIYRTLPSVTGARSAETQGYLLRINKTHGEYVVRLAGRR